MAFINSHKSFVVKSELDLFTVKPTQNCIESGYFQEYRPVSVLDHQSPIEFFIAGTDDYIDLSHTQIQLRVKIQHEDGSNLKPTDKVSPCNNFLSSLFEHVSIELNNKTITPPSNSYNYRAMIETLINFSEEAKQTHLLAGLFCKDDGTKMNDVAGGGFVERRKYMNGNIIELSGYLHNELTCQDKFMINSVPMRFKFFRSKPEFALMTVAEDKSNYKIEISDAMLLVRKAKINSSVLVAHAKILGRENIKYCINRVEIKKITISADNQSKMLDNIFIGES